MQFLPRADGAAAGQLYVKHMVPFVMGTTGGDRERLVRAHVWIAIEGEGAAHGVPKYGALRSQRSTCAPSRTP
ncbi:MAG: hypothetical protein ACO35F_09855 [Ilumatobacteraceae bacterium]